MLIIPTINILVKNNIIRQGTRVEAYFSKKRMTERFNIIDIITGEDNKVKWFVLARQTNEATIKVMPKNIVTIDGMLPDRILDSHELTIKEAIKRKNIRKYMHTNLEGKTVEYTEIIYYYNDGKIKKERFDEHGEKIRRGRKKKIYNKET